MRNPFTFFLELMQQPAWIPVWVFVQMLVNLASVRFWDEPLARMILVTFMVSAILMMGLYSRFGFGKLLGMGHMLWIPLLVYVLVELSSTSGSFKNYLIGWSIITAISLVFDIVDVWKYFTSRTRL